MIRVLSSAAILLAAMAPAAISAQNERSSPVPRYHLLQLSVAASETPADKFKTETKTIRTCNGALDIAKTFGADIKRNRLVRASALPGDLQDILEELPVGHATPVFSDDGKAMRVLVLCARV